MIHIQSLEHAEGVSVALRLADELRPDGGRIDLGQRGDGAVVVSPLDGEDLAMGLAWTCEIDGTVRAWGPDGNRIVRFAGGPGLHVQVSSRAAVPRRSLWARFTSWLRRD